MELSTKLLFLAAFVIVMIIMGMNHKKKKRRIIFFGDSITEFGTRPGGYINIIYELIKENGFEDKVELINAGIGGDKIYDLYLRVEQDVLLKEPQVVVLFIGVNDVWHKQKHGTGTGLETFIKFYTAVVKKLQTANCKIIICTPAIIGESWKENEQEWNDLRAYGSAIKEIAGKYQIPVADLHTSFTQYYAHANMDDIDEGVL